MQCFSGFDTIFLSIDFEGFKMKKNVRLYWLSAIVIVVAIPLLTVAILRFRQDQLFKKRQADVELQNPEQDILLYYYSNLSYKEQLLYKSILSAAETFELSSEALPYHFDIYNAKNVLHALRLDHPELYFVDFSGISLVEYPYGSQIQLSYYFSHDEYLEQQKKMDATVSEILNFSDEKNDPFSVELAIHDKIIALCRLNSEPSNQTPSSSAWGVLVDHCADNRGYALAAKLLLSKMDIPCYVLSGQDSENNTLYWCLVKIGEHYYHMDAAFDDADLDFAPSLVFHGYFNLSDSEIQKTRSIDLPTAFAADDETNYYRSRGLCAENESELCDIIYKELCESAEKGQNYIEICPHYNPDQENIKSLLLNGIHRYNEEHPNQKRKEVTRIYNVAEQSQGITVQLFSE